MNPLSDTTNFPSIPISHLNQEPKGLQSLPSEILVQIFKNLSVYIDRESLYQTCKQFHAIILFEEKPRRKREIEVCIEAFIPYYNPETSLSFYLYLNKLKKKTS